MVEVAWGRLSHQSRKTALKEREEKNEGQTRVDVERAHDQPKRSKHSEDVYMSRDSPRNPWIQKAKSRAKEMHDD
ncbi:hypothetical protein RJZ57_001327 [Blastomyces gilchristii]